MRPLLSFCYLLMMIWPVWILASRQSPDPGGFLRLGSVPLRFHIAALVGTLALSQILQSYLLVQELYLVPPEFTETYRLLDREAENFYVRLLLWNDWFGLMLSLMAGALMPAVAEELLFRGLVQRSFEQWLRPAFAILLSAFLFAALHLRPVTFIPLLFLGLFLGYLVRRTGSVQPAILGHLIFNASAILALYEPVAESAGRGEAIHTVNDLVAMLPVTALAILIFILSLWRINSAEPVEGEGKSLM